MIHDKELGTIEFIRSERSKHIRIRISPRGLKISMPVWEKETTAMKFLESVREQIRQKQSRLQQKEQQNNIIINEDTRLQTLTFVVTAKPAERKDIYFLLKNNNLSIEFPVETDTNSARIQQHIWNGISYFLRKEAKRLLPVRTAELAKKYGFTFASTKIQSSKTRWGSCSADKNINLSLYLMLLPSHLVDYVILHELCHTVEMNHSEKFWKLMDKVTDNKIDRLRSELKTFQMPQ